MPIMTSQIGTKSNRVNSIFAKRGELERNIWRTFSLPHVILLSSIKSILSSISLRIFKFTLKALPCHYTFVARSSVKKSFGIIQQLCLTLSCDKRINMQDSTNSNNNLQSACTGVQIFVEHWGDDWQFYPNFFLFSTLGGMNLDHHFFR